MDIDALHRFSLLFWGTPRRSGVTLGVMVAVATLIFPEVCNVLLVGIVLLALLRFSIGKLTAADHRAGFFRIAEQVIQAGFCGICGVDIQAGLCKRAIKSYSTT